MNNKILKVKYEIDVLKTDIVELIQDDKVQFDEMMMIVLGIDKYLKMINDGIINDEYISNVRTCKEYALNLIEQHLCEKYKKNELFSSIIITLEFLYEKLKDVKNKYNCKFEKYSIIDGLNKLKLYNFNEININNILNEQNITLRNTYYAYHRLGLDNFSKQNQLIARQTIANELLKLKIYENNFQMNYPFNIFIETKKNEIFNIFDSNNNGSINISELKTLLNTFSPKDADKWNKLK